MCDTITIVIHEPKLDLNEDHFPGALYICKMIRSSALQLVSEVGRVIQRPMRSHCSFG